MWQMNECTQEISNEQTFDDHYINTVIYLILTETTSSSSPDNIRTFQPPCVGSGGSVYVQIPLTNLSSGTITFTDHRYVPVTDRPPNVIRWAARILLRWLCTSSSGLESCKGRKVTLWSEHRQMVLTINWPKPGKMQGHNLKDWYNFGKTERKRRNFSQDINFKNWRGYSLLDSTCK